jgi:hypothetical protein
MIWEKRVTESFLFYVDFFQGSPACSLAHYGTYVGRSGCLVCVCVCVYLCMCVGVCQRHFILRFASLSSKP